MIGHRGGGRSARPLRPRPARPAARVRSRRALATGLAGLATAALTAALLPSTALAADPAPPIVSVTAGSADEGAAASVRARVSSPGADAVAAEIDWGDGQPAEAVTIAQLARGVDHVYGDDGTYAVSVTVTTSRGGVGAGAVPLEISNLAPDVTLSLDGVVAFPGGEYAVVRAGDAVQAAAEAVDPGSDDARFSWSTGAESETWADGASPDPPLSPTGVFPFTASDTQMVPVPLAGVGYAAVSVTDDDGGTTDASAGVVATGTSTVAYGQGWWVRQLAASRAQADGGALEPDLDPAFDPALAPALDAATASAYLGVVAAVSEIFNESHVVNTRIQAHALLAPPLGSGKERATGALLTAWLNFASGAVPWNAEVPLASGATMPFLDLMESAERSIASPTTTQARFRDLVRDLARVRLAEPPSPEPASPDPSAPELLAPETSPEHSAPETSPGAESPLPSPTP